MNKQRTPPLVSRFVDRYRLGNLLVSLARLVLAISPRRDLCISLV